MLALGMMLAFMSFLFVLFILKTSIRDLDNHNTSQTFLILSFIFLTTILLTVEYLRRDLSGYLLAQGLLTIFLMSMIALADTLTRRIPTVFFLMSVVFGIFLGVIGNKLTNHILGGLINFFVGFLIYYAGNLYYRQRSIVTEVSIGFGWGDAYATGALGFLLGFPLGPCSFIFSLIMALGISLVRSVVLMRPFIKLRLRLGSYFYAAAMIILLIGIYRYK